MIRLQTNSPMLMRGVFALRSHLGQPRFNQQRLMAATPVVPVPVHDWCIDNPQPTPTTNQTPTLSPTPSRSQLLPCPNPKQVPTPKSIKSPSQTPILSHIGTFGPSGPWISTPVASCTLALSVAFVKLACYHSQR